MVIGKPTNALYEFFFFASFLSVLIIFKVFEDGEIAYIAVVLFLYVCILLYSFYKLYRALYFSFSATGKILLERLLVVIVFITVFCICTYFLFKTEIYFAESPN